MFEKIRASFEEFNVQRSVKQLHYHHSNLPEVLKVHKELRPYVPKLKELCDYKNKLIFENKFVTATDEIQFGILMLSRNQDFFEGVLFALWHNNVHVVFPLMRVLVEDLFLLKYIDKNPEYIAKFMDIEQKDKKKDLGFLKSQSDDEDLKKYYGKLCDMTHPNPIALKYHLLTPYALDGTPIDSKERAIVIRPTCDELYTDTVKAMIRIYSEEIGIIDKIFMRNLMENIEGTKKKS